MAVWISFFLTKLSCSFLCNGTCWSCLTCRNTFAKRKGQSEAEKCTLFLIYDCPRRVICPRHRKTASHTIDTSWRLKAPFVTWLKSFFEFRHVFERLAPNFGRIASPVRKNDENTTSSASNWTKKSSKRQRPLKDIWCFRRYLRCRTPRDKWN